jgi:hypothetical protein
MIIRGGRLSEKRFKSYEEKHNDEDHMLFKQFYILGGR